MANIARGKLTFKGIRPEAIAVPVTVSAAELSPSPPRPRKPIPHIPLPALDVEAFWFIWSPTEFRPKCRHSALEAAQREAERLREIAPDKEFDIYRAERVEVPYADQA